MHDPEDPLVRENLMEHVGTLPAVAIAIFPYLDDSTVNLGDALTMLAIHDIGELIVGDVNTFVKQPEAAVDEETAALSLLHPSYHALYREVESRSSSTAKFAKAVDKIAPDILDYLTPPEITVARLKHFVGIERSEIMPLLMQHKRPYMLWNPFMTQLHKIIYERLEQRLATPK